MLSLALILISGVAADALADPTYKPAPAVVPAVVPDAVIPSAGIGTPRHIEPAKRVEPAPVAVAPEIPKASARPNVHWRFSTRYQTWFWHADPVHLENYVRSLDAPQVLRYAAPTNCPTGTCPRR